VAEPLDVGASLTLELVSARVAPLSGQRGQRDQRDQHDAVVDHCLLLAGASAADSAAPNLPPPLGSAACILPST